MARINAEHAWWTDERRYMLAEKLGNKRLADGLMLEIWKLSQEFWGNGRKKIPFCVFKEIQNYEDVLSVNLAIKVGELIYVRGTKQYHEWYASRIEQSSKGGKAKAKVLKQTASKRLPSISSSISISSSNTNTGDEASDDVKDSIQEWKLTLESFGIKKDPSFDEIGIQRLILRYGKERTLLALRGARLEPKTQTYDPGKHCSISRVSRPEVFDKFVNLGSQVPVKQEIKYNTSAALSEIQETTYDQSIAREVVRRITGK